MFIFNLKKVIEDLKKKKIVAAGTVFVEPKIIRGLATVILILLFF